MLSAHYVKSALKEVETAELVVKQIAPKASFNFVGMDGEYIYLKVVVKKSQITTEQKPDLY